MATKTHTLGSEPRTIVGKKVKLLRKEGVLPANIYGHDVKSEAVQVPAEEFEKVYKQTGETGLVELTVKGNKTSHHVLISNPQVHPVTGAYLHVDFHEVSLKEEMEVKVPVKFTGESPATEKGIGVFIQMVDELEVKALPTELPEDLEVDISEMKEVGDEVTVADIKTKGKFTVTADTKMVLARINPLEKEEVAPAPAPTAVEGEAAPEGAVAPAEGGEKAPEAEQKPAGDQKKPQE
jgi:large subunit ribosomal protein L25